MERRILIMKTKLEKIEEAAEHATNNMEKLEKKLNELNADTAQNKIIIWVVALIIAAIIIALRS